VPDREHPVAFDEFEQGVAPLLTKDFTDETAKRVYVVA
jgi:hypothetical protein